MWRRGLYDELTSKSILKVFYFQLKMNMFSFRLLLNLPIFSNLLLRENK